MEQLKLKYKYDNKTFINHEDNFADFDNKLEIILVNDFKRNIFINNISKTILNYVSHKNPHRQPIYNTDSSRGNYIIKINTKWDCDIHGNKLKELVIMPILNTIEKMIDNYIMNYLEKRQAENDRQIEWLCKTREFETKLHNNDFIRPILKELSGNLKFEESYLLNFGICDYIDENDDYEFTQYDNVEKICGRML